MKGLILKDLFNLRKYGKQIVMILGVFLLFGIMMKSPLYVCFMMMLYGTMTILTVMSYDERAGFDKYALSMPIQKKDLVISKYAVWFLVMAGALTISVLTSIVMNLFFKESIIEGIVSVLAVEGVYVILLSIVIPIMFKLGVEKGRMVMMAVLIVPSILAILIGTMAEKSGMIINPEKINLFVENYWYLLVGCALALVVVTVFISYKVSVLVVEKKEY
ncbi:MAG: ABC-2 transporter permease [Clostridiales bacterium]|nr:ABC-2 transporter permease [Clostridiales bacterium]